MFLRILLSTIGGFLIGCLLTSGDDYRTVILFSCLLGVYVGVMWGLWHKGVFDRK